MSGLHRATPWLGLGALGAAALAYAHVETKLFTVRHATVPVLRPGQPDVRILHLSDLHLTPGQQRKAQWLRSLAALRPDYVVNTGDNLAHVDALEPLLAALDPLLSTTPGAFVMGSNDYYAPRPKNPARYLLADARQAMGNPVELPSEDLAAAFRAAGWSDLNNRRDRVNILGIDIDLVGVDDPHLERDEFPAPALVSARASGPVGSVGSAPAGSVGSVGSAPAERVRGGALRLGVLHAPYTRLLDRMHDDGADVIIAGHTHGGQLCVPGFGALVTNCDLDRGRAKGLHGWPGPRPDRPGGNGSAWLHVSAGAGTSPYAPFRFACRPEATVLTLTAR